MFIQAVESTWLILHGSAYPPGDVAPAAYLCAKSANKTSVLLFLKHLLKVALNLLSAK